MTPSTPAAVDVKAIEQRNFFAEKWYEREDRKITDKVGYAAHRDRTALLSLLPGVRKPPLTIAPEIQADILAEARELIEQIEAHVSDQMYSGRHDHEFHAPDDAEENVVFTFAQYRHLGRVVSLLRDLSQSPSAVSTLKADLAAAQGRVEGLERALGHADRHLEINGYANTTPIRSAIRVALSTTAPAVTREG